MALIARLRREHDMGVLFVTHDLSTVEEHADAIHVLYAGKSVEWGTAKAFFAHPRHPYSEALLGSVARVGQARLQSIPGHLPEPESRPPGCRFAPRCDYRQPECEAGYPPPDRDGGTAAACLYPLPVNAHPDIFAHVDKGPAVFRKPQLQITDLVVSYAGPGGLFSRAKAFKALNDITLQLGQGECLGVVGESGSGKSTLGRAILQMINYKGSITLDGANFAQLGRAEKRTQRRRIQVVFQDPRESLNPRMRIKDIIAEPIRMIGAIDKRQIPQLVAALLARVGLNTEIGERLPGDVSGGQAQRIAIARALAAEPEIIVLDEPTSALDVSTQAMLLNLLKDLAIESRLSYILISHDFAVVSYMADRIVVLNAGQIVEVNDAVAIISNPQNDYTKALVDAAPQLRETNRQYPLPQQNLTGTAI
jgi:peptide/nickel transport system ATP-binding protein